MQSLPFGNNQPSYLKKCFMETIMKWCFLKECILTGYDVKSTWKIMFRFILVFSHPDCFCHASSLIYLPLVYFLCLPTKIILVSYVGHHKASICWPHSKSSSRQCRASAWPKRWEPQEGRTLSWSWSEPGYRS